MDILGKWNISWETTIVYWGFVQIMEKKLEATALFRLNRSMCAKKLPL